MMENFKSKFTEIYNKPAFAKPLSDIIGEEGITQEFYEILNGSYTPPPVIHPDIKEFIETIEMSESIKK